MDDSIQSAELSAQTFPVVGVGASAGGLEALTEFLESLPATPGMSFIIVQHLSPVHESTLAKLLQGHTTLPVVALSHGQPIACDEVYVIVENTALTVCDGKLHVESRDHAQKPHMPIDVLFKSMAEELQQRAFGAVFSGGGSDGNRGLSTIKEAGGVTFAQDPASARVDLMPRSAIGRIADG